VPAIPRPTQSYGYELNEDGSYQLQKSKVLSYSGLGQDTVGPACYDPKYEVVYSKRGSFIDIGRSQVQRKIFEHNKSIENTLPDQSNPGPGYYFNVRYFLCHLPISINVLV
jgi:hypothetical protein